MDFLSGLSVIFLTGKKGLQLLNYFILITVTWYFYHDIYLLKLHEKKTNICVSHCQRVTVFLSHFICFDWIFIKFLF